MSFESLPPEMLMKVFSFLTDIGSKVRLQRVNKQWLTCLKSSQSWALNTRIFIEMRYNRSKLRMENIALLEYAPKITFLKFHGTSKDPEFDELFIEKLWTNERKLRLEHLEIMNTDDEPCNEYSSFLTRLVSISRPTIKSIECFCCLSPDCSLRETFAELLRSCPGLRELKWLSLPFEARDIVSTTLKDLPIESLRLEIEGDHEWLATVVNAAKDNSIRELEIPDDLETFDDRELNGFLQSLSPSAADAIKVLKLEGGISDLFEILPTLPNTFPNLTKLETTYSPQTNSNLLSASKVAEKIGDFILCGATRTVPLDAWIRIMSFGKKQFSGRLWSAVGSLSACKSGTKRAIGAKKWKRILDENNLKVCIENEWDIY